MANTLAVRLPDLIRAAVPFYGGQPAAAEVPKIKAAILLQFAENDERVNAGWPAYEEALKKAGVQYTAHHYPGTNHGFHNDTTPRYDEAAAKLAWQRTLEFFQKNFLSLCKRHDQDASIFYYTLRLFDVLWLQPQSASSS